MVVDSFCVNCTLVSTWDLRGEPGKNNMLEDEARRELTLAVSIIEGKELQPEGLCTRLITSIGEDGY